MIDNLPNSDVADRMNLSLAVTEAAKNFHSRWRRLLGLDLNPAAPKEHWTRVKALSRRLAGGWTDEYDNLKPVAGPGSTFVRARIIATDVYDRGAPIPTVSASPDQNRFLKEVAALVCGVADELDIVLE